MKGVGALLVILGIVIILTPWVLFPVCEVEGMYLTTSAGVQMPMKCGWTARAETAMGALIIVMGGLLVARHTPETRQAVGLFNVAAGILVVLFPTYLIGMCRLADHPCRQLTLPALEVLGVIVIIIGAFLIWKRE
ncbi:MAG TPA: DUF4418 family protein [Methanospirillum sp.]|uniref:DUF4418 family protein n=1 Tax=Methanospirillum sp. TaxID=45200 RepID=UPI002CB4804D|nr:DUF4418 family protein [Methanospirillum sp.]HNQ25850.1 DUF4418 family protein [Methanoregulaceae archaeon]HPM62275.1 DUF4418 family protein [Methanoregulaceae archaeon]HPY61504.1 DUF4418 family protein [Methanospirillum sp.]HQA80207.1 DUF4418 family protein [Methanoregulaceae archaeon]